MLNLTNKSSTQKLKYLFGLINLQISYHSYNITIVILHFNILTVYKTGHTALHSVLGSEFHKRQADTVTDLFSICVPSVVEPPLVVLVSEV